MDNPKGYTLSPAVSVPPTYDTAFHGPEVLKNMPYYQLGETDMIVSKLSLGGTALGSGSCDQEMVDNILWTAVKAGVNYFDTSPWYGSRASEKVMGKALKKLPRNTYYIATKVGRYLPEVQLQFDFTRQRVRDSVLESMAHLQVDYLDLVQVHDVEFCRSMGQIVQHTLPALNELKAEGKIRYIGITGYNLGTLKRIVELSCDGTVDTVLSYCRFSLFNTDLMSYSAFFESRRIGVINASPVGMGLITPHAVPTWHPATKSMKVTCSKAAIYCEKMGINLAALGVKWCLHQPNFPTTLNSSTSVEMLEQNLSMLKDQWTECDELLVEDLKRRYFNTMIVDQWENLEPAKYWSKMEKALAFQPTDIPTKEEYD
ncbi:uncharacterized protein LOC131877691 [Tigriopus californicus]|uniref:uncharacterized protein LOC131877691 n=1 Tax=Tigriopus californicus TaxID=6832 RepID=UPI0027DAAF60|nr:uncharacterized protein LOC131877691 [Tigriopus californicus]